MDKETIKLLRRCPLLEHQSDGMVRVNDDFRGWNDSTVEFTDTTGELLAIKQEEAKLVGQLHKEMRNKLNEFWESKVSELENIETEEIEQDIPF